MCANARVVVGFGEHRAEVGQPGPAVDHLEPTGCFSQPLVTMMKYAEK
jgi:hypothetical protein